MSDLAERVSSRQSTSRPVGLLVRPRLDAGVAIYAGVATAALLVLLGLYGLLPGQSPPPIQLNLGAGTTECLRRLGWSALGHSCTQVGAPAGHPMISGLLPTSLSVLLAHLPWIDSWTAHVLVDVGCVTTGFTAMIMLLRRWGATWWASLGASFGYFSSLGVILLNGYTFTFNGFLLLPAGLLVLLWGLDLAGRGQLVESFAVLQALALASVFTDGYSFVEVLLLSTCLVVWWYRTAEAELRVRRLGVVVYAASVIVAAGAYLLYVPSGSYSASPSINFFRSMGADLTTIVLPTQDLGWASLLGVGRSLIHVTGTVWGDEYAYRSNYLGFVLIALAMWLAIQHSRRTIVRPLLIAACLSLFLALGPSLKVDDLDLGDAQPASVYEMPESAATLTLPTNLVLTHLPGVSDMRASYRWILITDFALFSCAALAVSRLAAGGRTVLAIGLGLLALAETAPDYGRLLSVGSSRGDHVAAFKRGPLQDLNNVVDPGDRLLFLPAGNDFAVVAMVPFSGATALNTGTDKNLFYAWAHWPPAATNARKAYGTSSEADAVADVLESVAASVVVFAAFDLRSAGLDWISPPLPSPAIEQRAVLYGADRRFAVSRSTWFLAVRLATP